MTTNLAQLQSDYDDLNKRFIEIYAKHTQRKTIHEMLNDAGIPREEGGKPLCLLRRIRILLDKYMELEKVHKHLPSKPHLPDDYFDDLVE